MKKLSSILLSLILTAAFCCMPFSASAKNTPLSGAEAISEGSKSITFETKAEDDEYDQDRWYKFTPATTGDYKFQIDNPYYGDSENDTYICIYSSYKDAENDENYIYEDMEASKEKISITTNLTANKVYYIYINVCSCLDIENPHTMTLSISKAVHTHTYKTTTTKATTKANGSVVTKCTVCGAKKSTTTIYYPKTITLSKISYVYNGKAQKPTITVKDSKGKKIAASNYTVSYQSGRKNVGTYTVTIKFKGNYSGTVKKTFTIKPKATTLSSVTAGKKKFTAKWKKQATQTTGYQIQYSTDRNFKKNNKSVTVSKNKTTSKSVSNLTAKKKYYVRIRTYKTVKVNGKSTKIYSSWSKSKSVKTK
ncbi:MAG: fibronectin type III domain-containing protein [Eubacterium sp.]|nr:fibronectin type III domain-containing protein [Eubacterium sp.]